jgi:hypothetical protein
LSSNESGSVINPNVGDRIVIGGTNRNSGQTGISHRRTGKISPRLYGNGQLEAIVNRGFRRERASSKGAGPFRVLPSKGRAPLVAGEAAKPLQGRIAPPCLKLLVGPAPKSIEDRQLEGIEDHGTEA